VGSDGIGSVTAAQLCVSSTGTRRCYAARGKGHIFGQNARAAEVTLSNGGKLLLFTAEDYAGANGWWRAVALLANRGGQLENLLPEITDAEEYHLWNLPDISTMPVFISTHGIWDTSTECHACPHRYQITSYLYNKETGLYIKYDDFITAAKHDDNVLESERTQIVASLTKAATAEAARHIIVK
jgi:hypothetical protein